MAATTVTNIENVEAKLMRMMNDTDTSQWRDTREMKEFIYELYPDILAAVVMNVGLARTQPEFVKLAKMVVSHLLSECDHDYRTRITRWRFAGELLRAVERRLCTVGADGTRIASPEYAMWLDELRAAYLRNSDRLFATCADAAANWWGYRERKPEPKPMPQPACTTGNDIPF